MFHNWVSRRRRAFERELERAGKLGPVRADVPPSRTDGGPPFRGGPHHQGDGGEEPEGVIADAADRDRARGRVTPHREGGPGGAGTGGDDGPAPIVNCIRTRRPAPRSMTDTALAW